MDKEDEAYNEYETAKFFCADNKIYEKYDIRTFKPIQFRKIKI